MRKLLKGLRYQLPMILLMLLSGVYAFAQDNSGSSQTTSTHTSTTTSGADNAAMWYTAPWVWVVGIVVLLLILVAIFSGKKNSKNEVIRTTRVTTEVKND